MDGESKPLNIAYPPPFVFKYRRYNPYIPAQNVVNHQGMFDFVGVKYPPVLNYPEEFFTQNGLKREWFKYPVNLADGKIYVHTDTPPITEEEAKMGGQLVCFKDVPYPYKGHPFPQAIQAMNFAKRLSRVAIQTFARREMWPFLTGFIFVGKKRRAKTIARVLYSYAETCRTTIAAYILGDEFKHKYERELQKFFTNFLVKMGVNGILPEEAELAANGIPDGVAGFFAETLAAQIGSDNAYWMRLGDAMAETTKEKMLADPRGEIKRLANIVRSREIQTGTGDRLPRVFAGLSLLLLVPKYKRIFRECVEASEFSNFQFDDADRYHVSWYVDYNYLGLPFEKRIEWYNDYHKSHPPLPPRIQTGPPA